MGFTGVKLYPTYESNNATSFVTNAGPPLLGCKLTNPGFQPPPLGGSFFVDVCGS